MSEYYVSTTGDDLDPGTEAEPWLTIQHALDSMVAGDTCNVASGTYPEVLTTEAHGSSGSPVSLVGIGRPVFYSITVDHAYFSIAGFKINGGGSTLNSCFTWAENSSHGEADDIIFDDTALGTAVGISHMRCTSSDYANKPIAHTVNDCQFLNNTYFCVSLYGTGHSLTNCYFGTPHPDQWGTTGQDADAIILNASNCTVSGNLIEDYDKPAGAGHCDIIQAYPLPLGVMSQNNLIENNRVHGAVGTQFGRFSDSGGAGDEGRVANWIWRNNVFANVEDGTTIQAEAFEFYNNTFYRCGSSNSPLVFNYDEVYGIAENMVFKNNIFFECATTNQSADHVGWWIFYEYESYVPSGYVANNNLIAGFDGTAGFEKDPVNLEIYGQNDPVINGQDPLFTDADSNDFSLQSSSPAIGSAEDLSSDFSDDIDGTTRVAPWDIGAFAYDGPAPPTTPPNAPTNLTLTAL